jgi:preprotein translocase subunit SecA
VNGAMSAVASVPAASLAARHAVRGAPAKATRGAPRPVRAPRGSALRCDAFLDKIKKGVEGALKGDPAAKTQAKFQARVDAINAMEPVMKAMSDDQLRDKTKTLQKRARDGVDLDALLVESFALVREASSRALGLRPFDVQLIGGMILHEGSIAEMRTGEGKTLVSALPAFLNALSGKGVHVVTVNDYLARRDAEWIGQIHKFLGLSCGLIQAGMSEEERRAGYGSDVTYVTNSELGFDYLRDNLAQTPAELVLRDFNFCVIDEVDSILIDEARTPLIISGLADKPSERYVQAAKIADAFEKDFHYTVDEKQKSVLLTEEGYEAAEELLQVSDLYDPRTQWALYIINAIKAKDLQLKDVSYIVKGKEVVIVDEFTGRTMEGRRWSDGLHQAVEAKEGLPIQNETVTIASVTYQAFFKSFPKLGGMTGTAETELTEFNNIYDLSVQVVPTNRSVQREDSQDVVFRSESGKWNAVRREIARMHKKGRPVLVGTTSVERSEQIAALLDEEGIGYELLNAKPENVERESEIVAQSGRKGRVTIATNMAGRGTDILLGGNAEFMARLRVRERLMPRVVMPEEGDIAFEKKRLGGGGADKWRVKDGLYPCELSSEAEKLLSDAVDAASSAWGERSVDALEAEERLSFACEKAPTEDGAALAIRAAFNAIEAEFKTVTGAEKAEVVSIGGLHVVGTERHESRRVDNQLRGRAGRQGDPGSTRYFLSLEDNLFRIFGGDKIQALMSAFRVEDMPIESGMLTQSLDQAQKKVETYFYDIRKQLFDYDAVLNSQREKLYFERRRALSASPEDLQRLMLEYAEQTVDDIVVANLNPSVEPNEWPLEGLANKMAQYCSFMEDIDEAVLRAEANEGGIDGVRDYLVARGRDAYLTKRDEVEAAQPGLMGEAEKYFVLTQTDNLWKEHLQAIKFVQQAVGLRGYAQKDPLIEYKLEGYNLFVEMMAQIRRNVIYSVYQFQPKRVKPVPEELQPVASAGAADAEFPEMGDGKPMDEPEPEMAVASKGSRKKGGKK